MWVVPAIVLPVGGGWMALQARLGHDQDAGTRRPAGDRRQGAWKRIVPLVALVVGAVAVFVVIIGAVSGSLT
jgi:hypothetical protein